ncbi:MAG TPA: type II secretion system minor pseudopilin GspI [Burkholderiales bacterium]|nr:type II secretion system minor pseudopilin GspI [Betaproteobacteria bacterium]HQR52397.1 type II secretion system minor pseudopilin GspI [Burkholderiales bacterium]
MAFERGFTLVEVLVALAIFGVALTAALRACAVATDTAADFRERLLAGWVAENRLAEYRLGRVAANGESAGTAVQGGIAFRWQEQVSATQTPFGRRVEVKVFRADVADHILARVVGYALRVP